ncbi:MAG: hypothetical protein IPJ88_15255 [Myxococcales bacterium]|nr:MAG: hypothetical protein IPJ88_15255 [Myxococcales bacterium]
MDSASESSAVLSNRAYCEALEHVFPYGIPEGFADDAMHPAIFVGGSAKGSLKILQGVDSVLRGIDVVADLYNQEIMVLGYAGNGTNVSKLFSGGASFSMYGGAAYGLENGLSDWYGFFNGASVGINPLPVLKRFLNADLNWFRSGTDLDGDHLIAPEELHNPPEGVYGFSVGATVGFDVLGALWDAASVAVLGIPGALPLSAGTSTTHYHPWNYGTLLLFEELKKVGLPVTLKDCDCDYMPVSEFVSAQPQGDCWKSPFLGPDAELSQNQCRISFEGSKAALKGVDLAKAICHAGNCDLEERLLNTVYASAVGHFRDQGVNSAKLLCPSLFRDSEVCDNEIDDDGDGKIDCDDLECVLDHAACPTNTCDLEVEEPYYNEICNNGVDDDGDGDLDCNDSDCSYHADCHCSQLSSQLYARPLSESGVHLDAHGCVLRCTAEADPNSGLYMCPEGFGCSDTLGCVPNKITECGSDTDCSSVNGICIGDKANVNWCSPGARRLVCDENSSI